MLGDLVTLHRDIFVHEAEALLQPLFLDGAHEREAERIEQESHPELYRGSSYTGDNTYPWQSDCPQRQDDYITYWEDAWGIHKIGGYV